MQDSGQQDYASVQNEWLTSVKSGSMTGEPTATSCIQNWHVQKAVELQNRKLSG